MLGHQGQPHAVFQNDSDGVLDILQILGMPQIVPNLASNLNEAVEVAEFQLGDRLVSYTVPDSQQDSVQQEPNSGSFYVVCHGRVRLLSTDALGQKEVPALVLEAGETFGADNLLCDRSLAYQAIAASPGQVAFLPGNQLQTWLKQLPDLQKVLQQQAKQRQCLIFLKTLTQLRSLTSHQLRQLFPYFIEIQIPAGAPLIQYLETNPGRFWLRWGEVLAADKNQPLSLGDAWGYPHPTPTDWIAQTDLLVYQLPLEHWETAYAIAPQHFTTSQDLAAGNGHQQTGIATLTPGKPHYGKPIQRLAETPVEKPEVIPKSEPTLPTGESIIFPKPVHRQLLDYLAHYPFIQQQSTTDCGAACLAMISQYWGKRFSLNTLRQLAGVGRSGASLVKGLATAAESLGFQARPVRASLSRLEDQTHPWIAHWQGDHYVVVYQVKGNRILIADPALGKRSLPRSEFLAGWTGYALLLDPTERLQTIPNQKTSLNNFLGVVWPYRGVIWQIILASLLIQVFGLITPLFTQVILDRVVVNKSLISLHVFAIGLLLFGIGRIVLTAIRQYLLDYFANRLDLTLISGFISHTLRLPLSFFASRHVGDIITRVQENQKIQMFLTRQAVTAWLDASLAVVYLGLMAYYNWQLTLLVIALIPPIVILTVVASPFLRRVSREVFNEETGQNSSLVEMITGIATVKAAAAEQELRWRWEERLTSTLNARFRGQKLANGLQTTGGFIQTLGSTALLWYGATLVIQAQLTIGQFVAFNMLIGNVINPVLALVKLWDEFQEVMVSVERLNDIFATPPEESLQTSRLLLPRLRGEVKFENVTFRYAHEDERNILQNVSFEISAGQTIAIVGRSGSGKTTLVSLLQGLYHPTSGRIWIDGQDLCHASPQSLRSQLGVVPQECFLFSGTILENITLYSSDFTLEQVVAVAKLAEANAFIQDLPLGYNTKVGERGMNLSGGQRQRIAIARALLGDPRILILDEATSSLDTDSERRFQQNLARISRDRTTLIIAHRLSTVRNADCILVLDRGILVERGTHEELIALKGLYYHLAQQQLDL